MNKDNSEISRFEESNFDSSANDSFGWVLHRVNRISGVFTADITLTSHNQVDAEPQRLLSMLKRIRDNEQSNTLVEKMMKIASDLEEKIQYIKYEMKRLSESIDLNIPYAESLA